jgi:hypothetical protein
VINIKVGLAALATSAWPMENRQIWPITRSP